MTENASLSLFCDSLHRTIRAHSLEMFRKFSHLEELTLGEVDHEVLIHGQKMGIILLAGKAIRINFKIHYRESVLQGVTEGTTKTGDFIREFSNLLAGRTKSTLERVGIASGVSLPLVTHGFDELFFPLPDEKTSFSDLWKIVTPFGSVICSTLIEILEMKNINKVDVTALELSGREETSGEVEFI